MTNHPNRSKLPDLASNPTPEEIRQLRETIGLTPEKAGFLVHSTGQAWKDWESGRRRMHPAIWELAKLKATHPIFFELWRDVLRKPTSPRRMSRPPELTFFRRGSRREPESGKSE